MTRFNIGDYAYVLYTDKVRYVKVLQINIDVTINNSEKGGEILYSVKFDSGGTTPCSIDESRLFETKQALLNSL